MKKKMFPTKAQDDYYHIIIKTAEYCFLMTNNLLLKQLYNFVFNVCNSYTVTMKICIPFENFCEVLMSHLKELQWTVVSKYLQQQNDIYKLTKR